MWTQRKMDSKWINGPWRGFNTMCQKLKGFLKIVHLQLYESKHGVFIQREFNLYLICLHCRCFPGNTRFKSAYSEDVHQNKSERQFSKSKSLWRLFNNSPFVSGNLCFSFLLQGMMIGEVRDTKGVIRGLSIDLWGDGLTWEWRIKLRGLREIKALSMMLLPPAKCKHK